MCVVPLFLGSVCWWVSGLKDSLFSDFLDSHQHAEPHGSSSHPPKTSNLPFPILLVIFFKFSESENMKEGHHKKWKSSYGWKFVVYPQRQRIMPDWFLFKLVLDSLGWGEVSNVRWSVKTEDTEIDFLYEIENFGGGFHCHYGQLSCPQTPKRVPQKFGPRLE